MSILIKGVSLDDFKPICPCLNGDYGCCDIPGIKRCYGIGKDGCPLIEIPPHGRLIDADALNYTMLYKENWMGGTGVEAPAVWKKDIDASPTIIPAEEGE